MTTLTNDQKSSIKRTAVILQSIKNGTPKFFNIAEYKELGLVKEIGSGFDTRFVLTEKAEQILTSWKYYSY